MSPYRLHPGSANEDLPDLIDYPDWPLKSLITFIGKKYDTTDAAANDLSTQATLTISALGGLQGVYKKRILDIGCGSVLSPDEFNQKQREFEPWTCRILSSDLIGASVVGVDRGDLSSETFEHYTLDLKESGALDVFPDNSFDIVINTNFLCQKKLDEGCSPILLDETTAKQRDQMRKEFLSQAKRILIIQGIYLQGFAGKFDKYLKIDQSFFDHNP